MRRIAPVLSLALVLVLCACGGGDPPQPSITGNWSAQGLVVGSSLKMQLAGQGNTVTGTGTYSIEAGRSGTLAVNGTYNSPQVTLSLAYDYGPKLSYAATFTDENHLTGTLTDGSGASSSITFARQ